MFFYRNSNILEFASSQFTDMKRFRPNTEAKTHQQMPQRGRSSNSSSKSNTYMQTPPLTPVLSAFDIVVGGHHNEDNWFHDDNLPPAQRAREAVRQSLRTNKRLNDYRVSEILGWGANGVVIAGQRVADNIEVAIKIIYKSRKPDGSIPAEIHVHQLLSQYPASPYLLSFVDYFEDKSSHYLVTERFGANWAAVNHDPSQPTEFLDVRTYNGRRQRLRVSSGAGDLFAYLLARKAYVHGLRIDRVKSLFRQIALGLQQMHRCGIANIDLKEENVLVDGSRHAKLCDYGHARVCNCAEEVRLQPGHAYACPGLAVTAYGTKELTPPEILENLARKKGEPQLTTAGYSADVWALGGLLLTMVNGRLPGACAAVGAEELTDPKVFVADVEAELEEILNDVGDADLNQLVHGMMDPNPNTRMTIDDVVSSRWFAS